MKIVVLDGHAANPGDLSWEGLEKLGDFTVYDNTKNEEILERIGDTEIVIVNKVFITREIIENCKNLKYIGVLATGYNNIDIEAAKEKNIVVCNVPSYSTASVSQLAIALLLEICLRVGHHSNTVHQNDWDNNVRWTYWDYPLIEIAGKTLGIIGLGQIGLCTAKIAIAMGMNVLAFSRNPDKSLVNENLKYVSLDELFNQSDVISLHCPLTAETTGIINKSTINKMKDGVIIINTSRGPLVVEDDLAEALKSGKVYAAGIDVVAVEPMKSNNPFLGMDNVIITPHFGWTPKDSRIRLMAATVNNVRNFIDGTPVNVVNP